MARNANTSTTLRDIIAKARVQWAKLMQNYHDTAIQYPVSLWQLGSLRWFALAGWPPQDWQQFIY